MFSCNRWLDSSEDDGQTARELSIDGPDGKPTLAWVHYRVQVMFSTNCNNYFIHNDLSKKVFTGDRRGAGTSANVSIQLYGDNGDSGTRVTQNYI